METIKIDEEMYQSEKDDIEHDGATCLATWHDDIGVYDDLKPFRKPNTFEIKILIWLELSLIQVLSLVMTLRWYNHTKHACYLELPNHELTRLSPFR